MKSKSQIHSLLRGTVFWYAYRIAGGLAFGVMIPILVPFLGARGYPLAAIGLGYAIVQMTAFVLEIPTGVVSDLVSRKLSLASSAIFQGASLVILILAGGTAGLYLGFASFGVGSALSSGTLTAWLHDTLSDTGRENRFKEAIGYGTAANIAAMVAGSALSSVIVLAAGPIGAMIAGAIAHAVRFLFSLFLREPPLIQRLRTDSEPRTPRERVRRYFTHTWESIRTVGSSAALMSLVLLDLVMRRLVELPRNLFTQPYFGVFGWTPAAIALVFVVFRLIEAAFAAGSGTVSRIVESDDRRSLTIVCALGAVALLVVGSAANAVMLLVGYILLSATGGLLAPFFQQAVNERAPAAKRASVLSVVAMGFNLTGIAIVPVFGRIADVQSVPAAMGVFHIVFLALLAIVYFWCSRTLISAPREPSGAEDVQS